MVDEENKKQKKIQRISAGDVIVIQYTGDNKPCDKCICVTLSPITIKEDTYIGNFHTAFAIDADTEQFIPEGPIRNVQANITKVTDRKLKKWFYNRVVALCKTRNDELRKGD